MEFTPIGVIRTPYKTLKGTPIQPVGAKGVKGVIELNEEYVDGLKDLDGFTYIILLYVFHKSEGYSLHIQPYLEKENKGLFATRFQARPNPIGFSVVKMDRVEDNKVYVEEVDMLSKKDTVLILGQYETWFHIVARDSVKGFVAENSIEALPLK